MTQFGRALAELNIEILCANSSQAKGRVERANHTLQDRLVKELRIASISDTTSGNAFLPGFVEPFNERFSIGAANRPGQTELAKGLAGQYVELYDSPDRLLEVRWKGQSLPYRIFSKDQRVSHTAVVENKRLGHALAIVKAQQDLKPVTKVMNNSEKPGTRFARSLYRGERSRRQYSAGEGRSAQPPAWSRKPQARESAERRIGCFHSSSSDGSVQLTLSARRGPSPSFSTGSGTRSRTTSPRL